MTVLVLKFDGVLEGGGVKGIGLVGALDYLEGQGYQPVNLAGTSAGAIVAALRAAGYAPRELKDIIAGLDFRKFEDTSVIGRIPIAGPIINILDRLGIYKGDYFLELMRGLLRAKGKSTFKDLVIPETADDPQYRYRLRVVASDITKGCMLVLPQDLATYGLAPDDFEVALAVRMSMSIPVFFRPVKFKSGAGKQHTVVDGGVLSNFPVELFDSPGEPAWPTFGFRLTQPGSPPMERYQIDGPVSMLAAMFGTMMEAHDARYIETHNFVRSITIDPMGVATTQFDLGDTQKEALYQSGRDAAKDFLAHWDFEAYKMLFRSGSPSPNRRELSLPIPLAAASQPGLWASRLHRPETESRRESGGVLVASSPIQAPSQAESLQVPAVVRSELRAETEARKEAEERVGELLAIFNGEEEPVALGGDVADLEPELRRFGKQVDICSMYNLEMPAFATTDGTVIPIDVQSSTGAPFGPPYDPDLVRRLLDRNREGLATLGKRSDLELVYYEPGHIRASFTARLTEFLAARFRVPFSSPRQIVGYKFTVTTKRSGLSILCSRWSLFSGQFFHAPTTPAEDYIRPGIWIFGAKGPNFPETWEQTPVKVPDRVAITLSIA